eukprot:COSAG02_NODE_12853_length_1482_cov_1.432393_2_plen_97_part_01
MSCAPTPSEFSAWGAVCDTGFEENNNQAKAVCQSLGFQTFELQPERCEPQESIAFNASIDLDTECNLIASNQVESTGIWTPGSCQVLQGNGRCKYLP